MPALSRFCEPKAGPQRKKRGTQPPREHDPMRLAASILCAVLVASPLVPCALIWGQCQEAQSGKEQPGPCKSCCGAQLTGDARTSPTSHPQPARPCSHNCCRVKAV